MIQLKSIAPEHWNVNQKGSLGNIERTRNLGHVIRYLEEGRFTAYATTVAGGDENVGQFISLPAAINALIELHRLTDYQYAPWPSMEEDEE